MRLIDHRRNPKELGKALHAAMNLGEAVGGAVLDSVARGLNRITGDERRRVERVSFEDERISLVTQPPSGGLPSISIAVEDGVVLAYPGQRKGDGTQAAQKGLWTFHLGAVPVGEQTSLVVSEEKLLGRALRKLGIRDIEVGIDDFDARFFVRGRDPDLVRGLLRVDAARQALGELFDAGAGRAAVIDGAGDLLVVMHLPDVDGDRFVASATAAEAFAERWRGIGPVPSTADDSAPSIGGQSGAPIAVRTRR